jgi:hypothetical protein
MVAAKQDGRFGYHERGNVSAGPTQRLQVANISDYQFNGIPARSETTHLFYMQPSD